MSAIRLSSDPEKLRKLPRPLRDLVWSLPIRISEAIARKKAKSVSLIIDVAKLSVHIPDQGEALEETAVTAGQSSLLLSCLDSVSGLSGNVVEIGAWRGVTTVALANRTSKTIYAVDPHPIGAFPGVEEAYAAFCKRVDGVSNIRYIRECSGQGFRQLSDQKASMVFIDAMHDFMSVRFDVSIWSSIIEPGGMLALHDVDEHPGVNLALQRVLRRGDFEPWGYCPNLMVLRKL